LSVFASSSAAGGRGAGIAVTLLAVLTVAPLLTLPGILPVVLLVMLSVALLISPSDPLPVKRVATLPVTLLCT
jgi:hypothetical protein